MSIANQVKLCVVNEVIMVCLAQSTFWQSLREFKDNNVLSKASFVSKEKNGGF